MLIQIAVFVLAVAVMAGGSYLYMRKQSSAGVEETPTASPTFRPSSRRPKPPTRA